MYKMIADKINIQLIQNKHFYLKFRFHILKIYS
jgi:hypothetical protein